MSSQPIPGPVPVATTEEPKKPAKKKQAKARAKVHAAPKPTKTLPNWRIGVAKQIDIVRAYAASSNKGTKSVTLEEASEVVGLSPTTTVMAHAFLTNIGLLKRTDSGLLPSSEALAFLSAYDWDPKTASHKLGPRIRETWFAEALIPRLSYGQAIEETMVVNHLAEASGASPEYGKELRMLVEFLVISGVVQREGSQVKLVKPSVTTIDSAPQQRLEEHSNEPEPPAVKNARISSSYAAQTAPGGGVDFNISVHIDMAEFGSWRPERINAFFRGIAEVLAAKADVEKGGAGS